MNKFIHKAEEFEIRREKDKEKYEKRVRLFKVTLKEDLDMAIAETVKENRMPLIVTGKE